MKYFIGSDGTYVVMLNRVVDKDLFDEDCICQTIQLCLDDTPVLGISPDGYIRRANYDFQQMDNDPNRLIAFMPISMGRKIIDLIFVHFPKVPLET